jgi:type I restriction enzyme S subunit
MEIKSWKYKNLGELVIKVGSGITPRGGEKVYQKNGHPLVRSQNVGWGILLLTDIAFIDSATHSSMKSTKLELGDVLLNITGASIGRSAIVDSSIIDGNVNQHVCIIRVKEKELNPYFLNQYLISHFGQKQIESFQSGGNRQGLNIAQIHSFKIPVPPMEEQLKIASILSKWDELIASQNLLIRAKEKYSNGFIERLLTKKLRFSGFTEDWEVAKVSDVFEFLSSNSFSRDQLEYAIDEKSVFNIHYGDIHSTYKGQILDLEIESKVPVISKGVEIKGKVSYLKDGDVIIADASEDYKGVGELVELRNVGIKKVVAGLHTFALRDKRNLTVDGFRPYLFKHPDVSKAIKIIATGSKVYGISKTNFANVEMFIPSPAEQQKIASILTALDYEIQSLKDELGALVLQKQGLMHDLLTGKIRVRY